MMILIILNSIHSFKSFSYQTFILMFVKFLLRVLLVERIFITHEKILLVQYEVAKMKLDIHFYQT